MTAERHGPRHGRPRAPRSGHASGNARSQLLEGVVRDVTQEGTSVVETPAGIVLSHGGLPGERVRVRAGGKQKGVLRGELERVLERSPARIEAPCPVADKCGGCALMGLHESAQRTLKVEHVARATQGVRDAGAEVQLRAAGPALGYRRRVRLAFLRAGGRTLIGYRSAGSHHIVDAETCVVLEPALAKALTQLRTLLAPALEGQGEIELAKSEPDSAIVSIACATPVSPAAYRAAEALASTTGIRGVALRVQDGAAAVFGEVTQSSVAADGELLTAPGRSFAQANASVNADLCELVTTLAEPVGARVLELYAGHGNLTVSLAREAAQLDAFELDAAAADACRDNVRRRGLAQVRVHTADATQLETKLDRSLREVDALVLDPPRGGAPGLAALAERCKPARIVYVSCHMTTLGRDLRALAELGYRADQVFALDMFPQTPHVEAVVRLRRGA